MNVPRSTFAVFWTHARGSKQQFHADLYKIGDDDTPKAAVARFKEMFPTDVVRSVRGSNGRFLPYIR